MTQKQIDHCKKWIKEEIPLTLSDMLLHDSLGHKQSFQEDNEIEDDEDFDDQYDAVLEEVFAEMEIHYSIRN